MRQLLDLFKNSKPDSNLIEQKSKALRTVAALTNAQASYSL
jgi:hypothetical protein